MSESEDQESNQNDAAADQQDQSRADDQRESEETITPAEAAKLRKELADTRKEAAKHRTDLRKVQADATKAEQDKAKEQGNFEKLYEAEQKTVAERDARIVELEGQIKGAEHASLRAQVAQKYTLPVDLADLLQGDDEAALEASAKVIAKHVRIDAPDTEAGRAGRRQVQETRVVTPAKTVDGVQKVAWTAGT